MTSLPELIGVPMKKCRQRGETVFHGPCPICGGRDRFTVWTSNPRSGQGGRVYCRQCNFTADGIAALMEIRGYTFSDACDALGIPHHAGHATNSHRIATQSVETQKRSSYIIDYTKWQQRASQTLKNAIGNLDRADAIVAMTNRLLTADTCRAAGIGYVPCRRYENRRLWGIPPDGDRQKILIPAGILISCGDPVNSLTIRTVTTDPAEHCRKYHQIAGSQNSPFIVGQIGRPTFLVESAIDAVLIWQETAGECTAIGTMGANRSLDDRALYYLRSAIGTIAIPDNDNAGHRALEQWQQQHEFNFCGGPKYYKDVGDMQKAYLAGDTTNAVSISEFCRRILTVLDYYK